MKRLILKSCRIQIWVFLSMVIFMTGCAGNKILTKQFPSENIIHYSQLKSLDETVNPNNYVVYINKGDSIPLKISMETDFMDFKQDQIDVIAKQKLYFMIKMPENLSQEELAQLSKMNAQSITEMSNEQRATIMKDYMLYVSKDGEQWAPLYGSRAYREVLGFKVGHISFAMLAGTTEGLEASLDIRTVK